MTDTIAVVVPVLGRPQNALPLAESVTQAIGAVPCRLLFICSPGDTDELEACEEIRHADPSGARDVLVVDWDPGPGDYARKINAGYRATQDPWIFTGADDLAFRPGWAEAALEIADQTRAGVIGTNDLGNAAVMAGRHATHSLVRRVYADELGTIDEPGLIYHEGYDHQWVDAELMETAQARGQWAFAKDAVVEHLHPFWGKSKTDATYAKGLAESRADQEMFRQRRVLWT